MGTHRRSGRRYHYRSIREKGRIRKVFLGAGAFAEFTERLRKLREYHEERNHRCWKISKENIETACGVFYELDAACEVLRDAQLLVAGFYKNRRQPWRRRVRGLRIFLEGEVS